MFLMGTVKLETFKTTCDVCGRAGGIWYERTDPTQAIPEGWTLRKVMTTTIKGPTAAGSEVVCDQCMAKEKEHASGSV